MSPMPSMALMALVRMSSAALFISLCREIIARAIAFIRST